ncbi:hypothetical protein MMC15_001392 [Xylographa vitiligo]|nr:hypothetical protein [Xylographa vitiligo]
MAPKTRIVELASTIQAHTEHLDLYYTSQGFASPSWNLDTPPRIPLSDTAQASQDALLDAMDELKALVQGPMPFLINKASEAQSALLGLDAITRFGMAGTFPVGGEASFAEISGACGLAEDDAKRFLRFAMLDRVFKEPRKGIVAHTPASKALADPLFNSCVYQICQEMWRSASRTVDAMVKWPGSQEPTQTGFSLANDTTDPMFVELAKDPARAQRFANAMTFFTMKPGYESKYVVEGYDWAAIGKGLLVDIGGSHGIHSIAIAEHFPDIRCIVQDRPDMIATAEVPPALKGRFEFVPHDFFTEQPTCADVFLLRWILHDWSDKYAIRILKSLVPALRHGAKIVVVEVCLPEPGTLILSQERQARILDMGMKQLFNAKERDKDDWIQLFRAADPRFQLVQITKPELSELSIIEFRWEEEP